jgi:hypothetical protein
MGMKQLLVVVAIASQTFAVIPRLLSSRRPACGNVMKKGPAPSECPK